MEKESKKRKGVGGDVNVEEDQDKLQIFDDISHWCISVLARLRYDLSQKIKNVLAFVTCDATDKGAKTGKCFGLKPWIKKLQVLIFFLHT